MELRVVAEGAIGRLGAVIHQPQQVAILAAIDETHIITTSPLGRKHLVIKADEVLSSPGHSTLGLTLRGERRAETRAE